MSDRTPPRRTGELREHQEADGVPHRTERAPLRHESAAPEDPPAEAGHRGRAPAEERQRRPRVEARRHAREPRGEAPRRERRAEAEAEEPRGRGSETPPRAREARADPPDPIERHSRERRTSRALRAERTPRRRERNEPSREGRERPRDSERRPAPARPRERVASEHGHEHVGELPTAEAVERRPVGGRERARRERTHREVPARQAEEAEPRSAPPVDVVDAPDAVTVFCDLPGCAEEDITVRGDAETLRIEADRATDAEEGEIHRRERPTSVRRTVDLPARADVEAAEATYEDGVLRVTLPKRAEERARTIGIE